MSRGQLSLSTSAVRGESTDAASERGHFPVDVLMQVGTVAGVVPL